MAVLPYLPEPAKVTDSVDEITVLVTGYGVSVIVSSSFQVINYVELLVVSAFIFISVGCITVVDINHVRLALSSCGEQAVSGNLK